MSQKLISELKNTFPPLISDPETYYRSRIVTSQKGLNTLVTNAQPLLSLLSRLSQYQESPDREIILENLQHEFKTFESRSLADKIPHEIIILARYLLGLPFMPILQNQAINLSLESNILSTEQNVIIETPMTLENLILTFSSQPEHYIDLIELTYITLALSYPLLSEQIPIRNKLYYLIKKIRGEEMHSLFLTQKIPIKKSRFHLSIRYLTGLSFLFLCISYATFTLILELNNRIVKNTYHTHLIAEDKSNENL